jgi:hypothetical protein
MEGRRGKAARPWPETKCRDVRELFDPTPSLAGLPIWPAAEGYRLTGTRTVSKYLPADLRRASLPDAGTFGTILSLSERVHRGRSLAALKSRPSA